MEADYATPFSERVNMQV